MLFRISLDLSGMCGSREELVIVGPLERSRLRSHSRRLMMQKNFHPVCSHGSVHWILKVPNGLCR